MWQYFTSVSAKDINFSNDTLLALAAVMRRNTTIQRLELTNASLNESFVSALADALADNRNSLLSSIDFSDNKYAHFPPTFLC